MKKHLANNFWMKLLSLGLAVMLWMIIKLSAELSYTNEKLEAQDASGSAVTNQTTNPTPPR